MHKFDNIAILKKLLVVGLFVFCVVFFGIFYNYHLHFEEQLQLFLLTGWYFRDIVLVPGGFINYLGEFFIQFYHLPFAGAIIIGVLLVLFQQLTANILNRVNYNPVLYPLTFIPALNYMMLLCDEFFVLSGLIGIMFGIGVVALYLRIPGLKIRLFLSVPLIILVYFLSGGTYIVAGVLMILWEILNMVREKSVLKNIWTNAIWIVVIIGVLISIPLIVRNYIMLTTPLQAVVTPYYYKVVATVPNALMVLWSLMPILFLIFWLFPKQFKSSHKLIFIPATALIVFGWYGIGQWTNMSSERIKGYDFYIRTGQYDKAIRYAESYPPRNNLALCMLNLALAKSNQLGDRMFHYQQNDIQGLFLPFQRENVAPMLGNEILFSLGFVNAAQRFAFESMETTPNLKKPVRMIKRLAETNLVNGEYLVAEKYLNLLKNTMFYRKWALDTDLLLHNEDLINSHPLYGYLRNVKAQDNYFIDIEKMPEALSFMLRENPNNRLAFEYLCSIYLLSKNPGRFMAGMPLLMQMDYQRIPIHFQEAIYLFMTMRTDNPEVLNEVPVTDAIRNQLHQYANIYTSYPNAKQLLQKDFANTYWYYFHFE